MNSVFYSKPVLLFITIKAPIGKASHQRISYWSDRLRKVSDTFLIVSEKNKIGEGLHFHALVAPTIQPFSHTFFLKGVHFNIKRVAESKRGIRLEEEPIEDMEELPIEPVAQPDLVDELIEQQIHLGEAAVKRANKRSKYIIQVDNTIRYMMKDDPQYGVNMTLIRNKKYYIPK